MGERLEACSYIDAVAKDVAVLHHHVADIDADAELHAPLGWQGVVGVSQRMLNFDGGVHGIEHAGEICQDTVASRPGDPAAMAGESLRR